jgi:UDPglucose 6-dehydrogenase
MRISVAVTGYVGLVTAVYIAENENGHNVTCVDIDENKIAMLKSGKTPIFEDGIEELIKKQKRLIV